MQDIETESRVVSGEEDLYPTRGDVEKLFMRQDPVIWDGESADPEALSREQLKAFERDGFLVVPEVFSPSEAEFFLDQFERLAGEASMKGREELVLEPGSDLPRSLFDIHRFSGVFDYLTRDRRILGKIAQILGGDVYLHHSRINIKRALEGRSFPWHSDFETWHAEDGLPRCRVVSAWVMLTENTEFNGPLYLVPGSHRTFVACAGRTPRHHHRDSLRKQEYGVPSHRALKALIEEGGMRAAHGAPGTLVLHEGNVMHGSPDNITPFPRTNLFFVYNSAHNKPAARPFAAENFRPSFLASRDFTPLTVVDNRFV